MLEKRVYTCHYLYFFIGFKYEPYLCNSCHDLLQKAMNFNDRYMSKNDATSIMKNSNLKISGLL